MDYPATPPWLENAPAKFIMCSDMTGCLENGAGTFNFELINPYTDAKIVMFTNGTTSPVTLASTPPIAFSDSNVPLRGKITRMADPTLMRVVWNSPHNDDNPTVRWGYSSGVYTNEAYAESYTYTREDLCGDPATSIGYFSPFYWNYAIIANLTPGSPDIVYYIYGSEANGWSAEGSFRAPPAPGPNTEPIHIIGLADMGMTELDNTTDHWAEPSAYLTTKHMHDWVYSGSGYDYSLVLHVGDVSYATGLLLKWALFYSRIVDVASRAPYLVVQGNHERDYPNTGSIDSYDSGGECGIATQTRFPSPTSTSHYQDEGWYSLVHGSATIIMINTEFEVGPGSTQYNFLNATLKAVDRTVTPWVIVNMHRPMYMVDDSEAGGSIDPQFQVFESLLYDYKVDLVLCGHVHNAYASRKVYQGKPVSAPYGEYAAPVHISIGNAGQGLTPINTKTYPEWVVYQASEWGYSTIHIYNSTDMSVELYGDSDNGLRYTVDFHLNFPRNY